MKSFSTVFLITKPTKTYTNVFFSLASDHGISGIMPFAMSTIRALQRQLIPDNIIPYLFTMRVHTLCNAMAEFFV